MTLRFGKTVYVDRRTGRELLRHRPRDGGDWILLCPLDGDLVTVKRDLFDKFYRKRASRGPWTTT